ncbi:hypothetical protein E4U32_005396 [Claviceps aff. humidiphila group G2b]|nr:hypothetical protein E4U32_005396 [Claviceps aff. humidiphila group G2b]
MTDWTDTDYTITNVSTRGACKQHGGLVQEQRRRSPDKQRAVRGVKATSQATGKPGHDVSVPLTNLDPGFSSAAGSGDRANDSIPKFVLNEGKAQ